MDDKNRYIRNPDFIFRKVVDEMILVPIHQNVDEMDSIYSLNDVGAFLWECLKEPMTLQALKSRLEAEYYAPSDKISEDVGTFLEALLAYNAVLKQ